MRRYLFKRAFSSLIALFLFVTFMFFVTELMIPGDFTTQFSELLTPEQRAELQQQLGLTQPLGQRYLNWLQNLLRGDLGISFYGFPVMERLMKVIPYTLMVFFLGTIIAFQLGQWLGRIVSWPTQSDNPVRVAMQKYLAGGVTMGAVMFYTSFPPWLAFLMTYILSRRLHLVRREVFRRGPEQYGEFKLGIWFNSSFTPENTMLRIVLSFMAVWLLLRWLCRILRHRLHWRPPAWMQVIIFVGLFVGSWHAFGFGPWAMDVMSLAATPLATYVLLSFGETLLIMKTSIADTLQQDYITTARAKGAPESVVRDRHAARTSILPVLSRFVVSLPYMLTGVVIVEDILGWPGISNTLFNSLYQQDMPMVMATLLLIGLLSAVARLVLDVLYALLDPRIRYNRGQLGRSG